MPPDTSVFHYSAGVPSSSVPGFTYSIPEFRHELNRFELSQLTLEIDPAP